MSEVDGQLDKEALTVSFHGEAVELDDLERFMTWLLEVKVWIRRQRNLADGGRRWVFVRGPEPIATLLDGKQVVSYDVPLVPIRPRKAVPCAACDREIVPGTKAWRQKPNTWAGKADHRFCNRCVQRGGPPKPPKLQIIDGGAG